ncbi:MAG: hypothetical protein ABIO81_08435 [Ginsengibacter sp.]
MIQYINGLYLKNKEHYVKGYVIMPNYLYVLIDFGATEKSVNTLVRGAETRQRKNTINNFTK